MILVAAGILPAPERRLGALGLPALALAAASLEVAGEAGAPAAFRSITGGLLLAGALTTVLAAALAIRRLRGDARVWLAALAGALALVALGAAAIRPGDRLGSWLAAAGLALGAAVLVAAADLARPAARWLEARLAGSRAMRPRVPSGHVDRVLWIGAVLATLLTTVRRMPVVAAAAGSLVTLLAYRIAARRGAPLRWPVLLAGALLLGVVLVLAMGRSFPGGPLAPAWEVHVGLMLAAAAAIMAGLWPLHHLVPEGWLVPAAAGVMQAIGLSLAPVGWFHWAPLVVAFAALGLWHGALVARPGLLLSSGTVIAFAAGGGPGGWGLALAAALRRLLPRLSGRPMLEEWCRRCFWAAVGLTALPALTRLLEGQVAYGVVASLGVVGAIWWSGSQGEAETPIP